MIRILLTDDHPLVREGIGSMLAGYPDITVVGQADSGPEAVRQVAKLHPDLVLMDLRMPGGDGVDATRTITTDFPDTRVVVLTTFETDSDILRAVEAGAAGYLLKDIAPAELAAAVRSAANGKTVLAPSAATALLERASGRAATTAALSAQELNVLRAVARGNTNAEIARSLFVSEATVKTYLARAFDKLGVNDRTSAVLRAVDMGLVKPA